MINFWRRKLNPSFNMHHPDLRDKIEFAFKSGNTEYYQFIEEHEIRTGRYKWILAYLQEHDLRMTPEVLKDYCDQIEAVLNKGEIGKAFVLVEKIRGRTTLAFAPDTIKRLASVIYFDESEDLSDYRMDYGTKKINKWDENGTLSFFLTRPIRELLGLKGISESALVNYMTSLQILQDIQTSETPGQSSENT